MHYHVVSCCALLCNVYVYVYVYLDVCMSGHSIGEIFTKE